MKRRWEWLKWWFVDHQIEFCAACMRVMFFKNARQVRMTTGARVHLCPSCYLEYYFDGEE